MHVRCGTAGTLHMLSAMCSLKALILWLAIIASQKHIGLTGSAAVSWCAECESPGGQQAECHGLL